MESSSKRALVGFQEAAIQRVEFGVVDVGVEHAFLEVVQDDEAGGATETFEGEAVEFAPDAAAGLEPSGIWAITSSTCVLNAWVMRSVYDSMFVAGSSRLPEDINAAPPMNRPITM